MDLIVISYNKIVRLDISVDDSRCVEISNGTEYLLHHASDLQLRVDRVQFVFVLGLDLFLEFNSFLVSHNQVDLSSDIVFELFD